MNNDANDVTGRVITLETSTAWLPPCCWRTSSHHNHNSLWARVFGNFANKQRRRRVLYCSMICDGANQFGSISSSSSISANHCRCIAGGSVCMSAMHSSWDVNYSIKPRMIRMREWRKRRIVMQVLVTTSVRDELCGGDGGTRLHVVGFRIQHEQCVVWHSLFIVIVRRFHGTCDRNGIDIGTYGSHGQATMSRTTKTCGGWCEYNWLSLAGFYFEPYYKQ